MGDTARQTAAGKVLWHFTMSLDGFVAGPDHAMDWMTGISFRPGLVDEGVQTTGAVLGGRDGWDGAPWRLGAGIRLYDNPGGEPIRLERVGEGDPTSAVSVRYRPISTP